MKALVHFEFEVDLDNGQTPDQALAEVNQLLVATSVYSRDDLMLLGVTVQDDDGNELVTES